jgi:putative transcriptional regulator
MENELQFNNRIRMWRAEKRISQGDLAEMVGTSRQTISSIENLQFCPSAKLALLICIALDKKFEDVFYFDE